MAILRIVFGLVWATIRTLLYGWAVSLRRVLKQILDIRSRRITHCGS